MLDHYIQRDIVYHLAFADQLRFGELKPDDIDNKLFTYHLKKVIAAGFVEKRDNGAYALTAEGRRVGKGARGKPSRFIDRAYSVLFLAIRRASDDTWLLYRRRTQPLLGLAGFMHGQPTVTETCEETATRVCLEKTGLRGKFQVVGSGYFRVYRADEVESFTHFTLLSCDDIQGELIQRDELAEYWFVHDPDFSSSDMLPSMTTLAGMCAGSLPRFVERTFHI